VKVVQDLVAAAKARKPAPPPVVEPEAWQTEEQAAEVFHYQEKQVEIPKDLGEQPVAAFSDLLGTDAEPEAAKLISEVPATETSQATLLATEAVSPSVSKAAPAFPEQTIQEFPASVESLPETHEMEPASTNPLLTVEAAVEQSPEAASSQPGADFWARFGGGQEPEADRAQQPAAEESTSPKPHEAGANLPGSELWAPLGGPQEIESAEDRHPPTAEIPQAEAPLAASTNLPGTDFLANFGAVEEIETVAIELPPAEEPPSPEPQAAQKIFWVVETAEVTAEDRKLFDQSQSDWEGLTKMVEEQSTESSGGPSTNLSDRTISPGAREDEVPTEPLPSPHVQVEASGAASPGSIAVSGMPSPEAANDTEIA
jgi:hypothetical protein